MQERSTDILKVYILRNDKNRMQHFLANVIYF